MTIIMNTNKHIFLPFLIALAIFITSCGDFGDINIDPNNPSEDDTRYLLIRAEQGVTHSAITSFAPSTSLYYPFTQLFPQYLGEGQNIQYTALNINNLSATDYYSIFIRNLMRIEQMCTDEALNNGPRVVNLGDVNAQIAIAKTLKGYYMMCIADIWGSMPHSEMVQGEAGNFTPKFDAVKDIYTAVDKELKEAYGLMNDRESVDGNYDIIYGGNMSNWKKLNASIRMAMAIKLSDVDAATGKARFADAYNQGGIMDNSANMTYQYLDENANASPLFENYFISGRVDFYPTSTLVDAFLKLHDARVMTYAAPQSENKHNIFCGAPWGMTKEELTTYKVDNPLSLLADQLVIRNYNLVLISAAKVKLMCAEAAVRGWISADANALYEDAIRLSYEEKGVAAMVSRYQSETHVYGGAEVSILSTIQSQSKLCLTADEYLAQPSVKLTGSNQEKIEKIALQRWLNGFMQNGIEAWSDWRRLNVPKLDVGDFARINNITHIPYRMVLSTDDWDQNRDNYNAMVSEQGENSIDTRVWWDVADNH